MKNSMTKKSLRWLPAVLAPVLVVGGVVAVPAVANAVSTPPTKTAQQVLQLIAAAGDLAYSGTVQQSSDLGLPQLPSVGTGSSSVGSDSTSQIIDLLTANHTARVFVGGATKERVQVLDTLAERDVVRNGADVWTYDSKTKTATHLTLPAHSAKPGVAPSTSPTAEALTPAQLANRFIASIEPSTKVSVSSTAEVAGRSVYQLTLTPKSGTTLVAGVTLSVDAATGLPLKVTVDARGQKSDAFSVGFSSIDFSAPAASTFDFTPPKGATVTTEKMPQHAPDAKPESGAKPGAQPKVTGTAWDSIVELPAGSGASKLPSTGSTAKLLNELLTPVAGGRALQTSLISVLLLDDGRTLIGAVPIASLESAAQ
jgi:outer membrane lipoprotein-sorting protein